MADALRCLDGCPCRHLWGRCDCLVCTDKRERMKTKGKQIWIDYELAKLKAPEEASQQTLSEVGA